MMRFILIIIFFIFSHDAFSYCITPQKSSLYGVFNFANTDGFVQIPKGGSLITSSNERPTLDELGINHFPANNAFFDIGLKFDWCRFGLYADYQHNHPNGTSTLTNDLLTHAILFPAGTFISTQEKFDLYRLGFNKKLACTNIGSLSSLVEVAVFDFSYSISTQINSTNRAFNQFTERFGLAYEYCVNQYLSCAFVAASSLPVVTNLQIQTLDFSVDMNVLHLSQTQSTIFAGIGYQRIEFEDKQPLQNHIVIEYLPITYIGLKFKF